MRLVLGAMVSLVLLVTGAHAWQWPWTNPDEMANKLFVEAVPLWTQYQTLPEQDPAQYEARLKLLTQVNANLVAIVADYPESSLAVELVSTGNVKNLNKAQVEELIVQLEQSVPASALVSETLPIWEQYEALPWQDPGQYEARLKLLTQVDANMAKLLADFPRSYEAVAPNIDTSAFRATVIALEQSIPAAALMAETLPLWDQYQALPTDNIAHNDARLKLLTQVNANFEKILKDYPLSYEAENLPIDTKTIKAEIPYLVCASDIQCLLQLAFKTAEGITDDFPRARALAHISGAQAASGDVAGALKTAEGITDDSGRAWALAAVSGALIKENKKGG